MKAHFHKTFVLERDNISKILAVVSKNPSADRQTVAEETGIGIGKRASDGKVRPTIQYAIYSGLLTPDSALSKNDITLSDVGKIVFELDPRLKLSTTQWVMHYSLCRTENEALVWSFFVHDFLPCHPEFTGETLQQELERKFEELSDENAREYRKILTSCYLNVNALSKVGLIESSRTNKYQRGQSRCPNPYLVAYFLAEIWESKSAQELMVSHDILLKPGHLATTINLNRLDLQACLDELSSIGAIRQMLNVPPFQVIRNWTDKFDFLRHAYKEG